MAIRNRGGIWHYRFNYAGVEWAASTDLAATKRNENEARAREAEARRLAQSGQGHLLKIQPVPFIEAATMFLAWAQGEHRDKPATWKRLRGSMTSLKVFLGARPVNSITSGDVELYKTFRRGDGIKEITLRHDLLALQPFFEYARRHNWCQSNPVKDVKKPSARGAVRIHVLTPDEEKLYFGTCQALSGKRMVAVKETLIRRRTTGKSRRIVEYARPAHQFERESDYQALYDLGRLMLNLGLRPDQEARVLRVEHIDLERGFLRVIESKTAAGKRELRLTPEAREILSRRIAGRSSGWIFTSKRDASKHCGPLNKAHGRILKSTKLGFVIYDFRHTAATRWAERGMDIATIAKLLGHNDLRTVLKYVHISTEHAAKAIEKFGESDNNRTSESNVRGLQGAHVVTKQ